MHSDRQYAPKMRRQVKSRNGFPESKKIFLNILESDLDNGVPIEVGFSCIPRVYGIGGKSAIIGRCESNSRGVDDWIIREFSFCPREVDVYFGEGYGFRQKYRISWVVFEHFLCSFKV